MIQIEPIQAFSDNYIWMLSKPDGREAWVVDPGDAQPVIDALEAAQKSLQGILITHHHPDHIGGIQGLQQYASEISVIGPHNPGITALTQRVAADEQVDVLGREFSVLEVPGHTLDHIAYFSNSGEQPVLFCGDTLFAGGCGRIFEGTAEQMWQSLACLSALPADTQVYCAHEYTLANLAFAAAVEPGNQQLAERIAADSARREQDMPTVPSTLALELETNPFLRADQADVIAAIKARGADTSDSCAVFAATRAWKDSF